jgi:sulfur carrier protein ThiS
MQEETVTITSKNRTYQVRAGIPLHKALKVINISANSYLAVREGLLITEDEMLKNGDQIELIAVISGG